MYTTCLFCSSALGANEAIEHFPVGRRLAFDAQRGRLWVVCRGCQRWNLSPLEERWEAIEECERLFRGTYLRKSTEHIGLARLAEGLDLVRIGDPLRPEIAAWRYGDQFGHRRRRQLLSAGAIISAGGVAVVGSIVSGLGVLAGWQVGKTALNFAEHGLAKKTVAHVRDGRGTVYGIRRVDMQQSHLFVRDGDLALSLAYDAGRGAFGRLNLKGQTARDAAVRLLPAVNPMGGSADEVQAAVGRIERAGSAERFLRDQARRASKLTRVVVHDDRSFHSANEDAWQSGLYGLSTPASLALEMALHEEQEQRALEGELAELEKAWRDAEEVGAIADSLLLPNDTELELARLRVRSQPDE